MMENEEIPPDENIDTNSSSRSTAPTTVNWLPKLNGNSPNFTVQHPVVKRNNNELQLANLAGGEGRWSVEENSLITDDDHASNGHLASNYSKSEFNNYQENKVHSINKCSAPSIKINKSLMNGLDSTSFSPNISENNLLETIGVTPNNNPSGNYIEEQSDYSENKAKINNNCSDYKTDSNKDSMDYFKTCTKKQQLNNLFNIHKDDIGTLNNKPLTTTTVTTTTGSGGTTREVREYTNHQINLLNGDDYEDEDGCIYTYKEGPGFEDKLIDHLLTTCVSCGLPNLDPTDFPLKSEHKLDSPINGILKEEENVFSPDMDFLEMDFDPGSNADDVESSDCDDNCFPVSSNKLGKSDEVVKGACAIKLPPSILNEESNNLSPDRKTLMLCKRCENDPSINKTMNFKYSTNQIENSLSSSSSFKYSSNKYNFNLVDQKSPLDNRLHCVDEKTGAISKKTDNSRKPTAICNGGNSKEAVIFPLELNLKPVLANNGSKCNISLVSNESNELGSDDLEATNHKNIDKSNSSQKQICKNSFNNNVMKCSVSKGDISVRRKLVSPTSKKQIKCLCKNSTSSPNRSFDNGMDFKTSAKKEVADITIFYSPNSNKNNKKSNINKKFNSHSMDNNCSVRNDVTGNDSSSVYPHNSTNNNLGSLSAPEVSPAHEHPQNFHCSNDKFKRSVSFHNQLSSPKYDNLSQESLHDEKNMADNINEDEGSPPNCVYSSYLRTHRHSHPCNNSNYKGPTLASNDLHALCLNEVQSVSSGGVLNIGLNSSPLNRNQDNTIPLQVRSPDHNPINSNNISEAMAYGQNVFDKDKILQGKAGNSLDFYLAMRNSAKLLKTYELSKTDNPSYNVNFTHSKERDSEDITKASSCPTPLVSQKVMVWSERQAIARQIIQTEKSSCGLSAIANVLLALEHHIQPSALNNYIKLNKRAEGANLVDYLTSRSCAGTTHQQLIDGIIKATSGSVTAKFFPMFPKRAVQLSRWLTDWIAKGAVCICTLNLQKAVSSEDSIPDAWHHQMVFGVSPQGIHLTNPVECVSEAVLSKQLCSERVLLVKREDVIRHHSPEHSIRRLAMMADGRWRDLNVLGQVGLVLKEDLSASAFRGRQQGRQHMTSHVSIPAAYESGITVFMRSDNEKVDDLIQANDLPLLK